VKPADRKRIEEIQAHLDAAQQTADGVGRILDGLDDADWRLDAYLRNASRHAEAVVNELTAAIAHLERRARDAGGSP
jgi:hypothetical protein